MGASNEGCCSDNNTTDSSTNTKRRKIGKPDRLGAEDDDNSVTGSDASQGSLMHLMHTETQRGFAVTEFKQAIAKGDEDKAMRLVEEYAEMDMLSVTFGDGGNCLHEAVKFKEYKVIVFLLENGVSPNIPNTKNGDTPLHIAVRAQCDRIVVHLLMVGADATAPNNAGETPGDIAKEMNFEDIIELLEDDVTPVSPQAAALMTAPVNPMHQQQKSDLRAESRRNKYEVRKFRGTGAISAASGFQKVQKCTDLEGWLDKKKKRRRTGYDTRWVVLKGSYILWGTEKIPAKSIRNVFRERKRFKNSVDIMHITNIQPVTSGKQQNKFSFVDGDSKKEYIWKCLSTEVRDQWVNGLKEHQRHVKELVSYLQTK